MLLTAEKLAHKDIYKLLIGAVVPRPIAWVSTMNAEGALNLAPYSFFTIGATNPMTLIFCPQVPDNPLRPKKDTLRNIEAVPEFVINIVSEDVVMQMNRTATDIPYGESEFEWAGLTPHPSTTIRAPRVAEAPVSFECKLQRIVTISDAPGGGSVVFGEVQCVYVRDDVYDNGRIILERLKPVGRLAGADYTRVTDIFELSRIPLPPKPESEPQGS